jgi:hypothetical protein
VTPRAIVIGIVAAIVFAAGGRYVNAYVPGPAIMRGQLPISVFGLLIAFTLVVNPALGKIRHTWRFKASEMALILALLLGVSCIIDAGLMRYFPSLCVYPVHAQRTMPGWQKTHVIDYVPDAMLVNDGKYSEDVVGAYISEGDPVAWPSPWYKPWKWADNGKLKEFGRTLKLSWDRVPWLAWRKPLMFWGAILVLSYSAVVALSVIVHRQWATKERIRYPLAEIASSLLIQDEHGRTVIFHQKVFWVGFVVPMFIALVNLPSLWYPGAISIPMDIDFSVLNTQFPDLMKTFGAKFIANFKIYPAAVGIAFLIASDIGFGLGVSNIIAVGVMFFLLQIGVDTSGGGTEGGAMGYQNFGAYLGYAVILVYVGRHYYWATAKQAFALIPQPATERASVWGLRIFFLCTAALVAMLMLAAIPWHMAILGVLIVMLVYIVIARLSAEAGAFFCMPSWTMANILLGFYGFNAMGPSAFLGLALVTWVLTGSPFESLMPFAVNGLKTTTDVGLKAWKVGTLLAVTVITALAFALFTGVWSDYQQAASMGAGKFASGMYGVAERNITKLELAGELDRSRYYTSCQRLKHISSDKNFPVWTAAGFILVLGLTAARLRWAWWPLHPVIILTFGSAVMVGRYGPSLLFGWFIKMLVVKLAGSAKYMELRPMMIGVIAGDIAGGFVTMAAIWGYYIFTGTTGPSWQFW